MFYKWDVIGHVRELEALEQDLREGNIASAYLFAGPEKIGKSRIAKEVAGILQCPSKFCRSCPACIQVEKGVHPDTILVSDEGDSIKIELIRDLITRLHMTPQSNCKILIIENVERMTTEAANAFLKTIEEPPPQTIFLFTSGNPRLLLPTLVSRMRIIHFQKLPDAVLLQSLQSLYPELEREALQEVVMLSLGRAGEVLQLLRNPEKLQHIRELYRTVLFLFEKASLSSRFLMIKDLTAEPKVMEEFLALTLFYLRQKLLGTEELASREKYLQLIEATQKVISLLSKNVNARLLFENLMLHL